MEFSRRARLRPEPVNMDSIMKLLTPHNVCLYAIPPIVDLTIGEFESLALERLKVLRIMEQATAKNLKMLSDDWKDAVFTDMNHENLKSYVRLCQGNHDKDLDRAARRIDYLSHFILRFAYCRSEELRRWFISREMELFRLKFSGLSTLDIKEFVEQYDLSYTPLTQDQKDEIKDALYESTAFQSVMQIETMDFYRVHFTEVLDLIRTRRCYVQHGYAYVCTSDFVSIIANKQQKLIEDGLQSHLLLLPELENDERFSALLKGIHTSYTGKDYTVSKTGEVPYESIDQLAKKSFPLCMRYTHDTLRTKHHLKHHGRLQHNLFLKAIGVTLEDALRYWREELTRGTVSLEKFEKEYAYNIRHNYGKEGSRINYTPHSCMKIITSSVGPQDTHGCPFKIWEPITLKSKLASYGLSAGHVDEIVSYASKGHFQIACGKYFEISHQAKLEEGITHPNQYFELSQITMGARAPRGGKQLQQGQRKFSGAGSQQDIVVVKSRDTTKLDANDDDELWKLMERKENDRPGEQSVLLSPAQKPIVASGGKSQTQTQVSAWGDDDDDDFDVSQVEMD